MSAEEPYVVFDSDDEDNNAPITVQPEPITVSNTNQDLSKLAEKIDQTNKELSEMKALLSTIIQVICRAHDL